MIVKQNSREWLRIEFRINKKGAECFRTEDRETALEKLAQLQAKRPGIYTMHTRERRKNKYGQPIINYKDGWGIWG